MAVTKEQKEAAEAVSNPAEKIANLERSAERHEQIIYLVIVVLFIGFALFFVAVGGLIVTYESQTQGSYENLKDQIVTQNAKIDDLTNGIVNLVNR